MGVQLNKGNIFGGFHEVLSILFFTLGNCLGEFQNVLVNKNSWASNTH